MRRTRIFITVAAMLATLPTAARADQALTSETDQVRWTGTVSGTTGVALPEACVAVSCHEMTLSIDLHPSTWSHKGGVQVSIRWTDETQDLDLVVYGPDGSLAGRSEGPVSTAESTLLWRARDGAYRVVVVPTAADNVAFEGSAEVEFAPRVGPPRDLVPDLVSLPPRNLRMETSAYLFKLPVPSMPGGCYAEETLEQGARKCLRFDQILANVGDGPFEIRYRLDGIGTSQRLEQRIYRSNGSTRDRFADTYTFHPAHAHFHYENFAQSHLWAAAEDGTRIGDAPVRSGRKNGFCMVDVEQAWFGLRGDAPRTYIPPGCLLPTELDPATGALSAISGISVGWADVYNWYLPDQFIEISGVPDGLYVLENVADQAGTVEELDDANNAASALIRICGDQVELVGVDDRC